MWINPAQKMISPRFHSAKITSKNGDSDKERTTLRKCLPCKSLSPQLFAHMLFLIVLALRRECPYGTGEEVRLKEAEHSLLGIPTEGQGYLVALHQGQGAPRGAAPIVDAHCLEERPPFLESAELRKSM